MNYYWESANEQELRELIEAEAIEEGLYSLSLIVIYTEGQNKIYSNPIKISVDDFTKYFSQTVGSQIKNKKISKNIKAIITKKNIKNGNEERINIENPPIMRGI